MAEIRGINGNIPAVYECELFMGSFEQFTFKIDEEP